MPEQNNDAQDAPITDDTPALGGVLGDVAAKINESQNILIALSSNPSVDEMAAAISLSMYLEKLDKNVTAIYSGQTPDALQFLKPEDTFEQSADVLQDFVIAISKDKADHLRYKMDGDFVKIYITPYKTRVSDADLDFSYGDFNVDLVLALDVANGIDLDSALREHGRIMHDAVVINITTGKPGKFGEIEWSNPQASSISEMIADLMFSMGKPMGNEEATALLTGVVAATNSFSNARTSSETMRISSELMEAGANQQLVSMHITKETDNELIGYNTGGEQPAEDEPAVADDTQLEIEHEEEPAEEPVEEPVVELEPTVEPMAEPMAEPAAEPVVEPVVEPMAEPTVEPMPAVEPATEPVVEPIAAPEPEFNYMSNNEPNFSEDTDALQSEVLSQLSEPMEEPAPADGLDSLAPQTGLTLQPTVEPEAFAATPQEDSDKYSQMLEDALNEADGPVNPATVTAQAIETPAEVNGVPVINYASTEDILPPPPVPPVNLDEVAATAPVIEPVAAEPAPVVEPMPVVEPAPVAEPMAVPVMETQPLPEAPVYEPVAGPAAPVANPVPSDDPSAFKIPGMN